MMTKLSPSGARIRGDDYQHLFMWVQVLKALHIRDSVTSMGIEDLSASGADDTTVYSTGERDRFFQVKFSVDGRAPADATWLTAQSQTGGPSILQKLHRVWSDPSRTHRRPHLELVTNRLPDSEDLFFQLVDGRDRTVATRLMSTTATTKVRTLRTQIATHLDITEDALADFLSQVRFCCGKSHDEFLEGATHLMHAIGLRHDDEALRLAVSMVREWVAAGRRILSIEEIRKDVQTLDLQVREASAILAVYMIDRGRAVEGSGLTFDWVDQFDGDEARVRRLPRDAGFWNSVARPAFKRAAQELREQGHRRILLHGHARLPTWFALGVELARTSGFEVVIFQGSEAWASDSKPSSLPIHLPRELPLGEGNELAVGICVATDLSEDVLAYLRTSNARAIGRYVAIGPLQGCDNLVLADSGAALACACGIRDQIRVLAREHGATKLHLFLAGPRGLALLLGHLWDRMPATQLYEDCGHLTGYAPSFLLPN